MSARRLSEAHLFCRHPAACKHTIVREIHGDNFDFVIDRGSYTYIDIDDDRPLEFLYRSRKRPWPAGPKNSSK